jgi:hypothetical protein
MDPGRHRQNRSQGDDSLASKSGYAHFSSHGFSSITVMAKSGQVISQRKQTEHFPGSPAWGMEYPERLRLELALKTFRGHTSTQRLHPLQN